MISVQEAREKIVAAMRPTPAETVALPAAWNRVTATPVIATPVVAPAGQPGRPVPQLPAWPFVQHQLPAAA